MRAMILTLAAAASTLSVHAFDDHERRLTEEDLSSLKWRSVGPSNMGGRVSSIALSASDPKTIFVGYASGGIWKSTNNGTTFSPIFDDKETASIGALELVDAPADWAGWDDDVPMEERAEKGVAKILWVGTGEGNGRNSSSWGHGVYRSTDGGASFEHLGLEDAHDIHEMAVHPDDPDVCYVAALGALWGPNATRGIFKTTDGGQNWDHVLDLGEDVGACDVVINPDDPDTVFTAMYHRRRTGWSFQSGDTDEIVSGGIYRSTDGGENWEELTDGLPEKSGRIGLWICEGNSSIIYANVESSEDGHIGGYIEHRSRGGGLFRSTDGGDSWEQMSDFMSRPFYFSEVRTDPTDCDRIYLPGFHVATSFDGGRTIYNDIRTPHVDYHAMAVNPNDPDHLLVGNDGGLYISWDGGKTWDHQNHMAVGQFYNVTVDDSEPYYRIGGGLQDNGSWFGYSEWPWEASGAFMGRKGAISAKTWEFVLGGDGFHVAFHPDDEDIIYAESQGGNLRRVDIGTGQVRDLRPAAKEGETRYRFNWNAPFFISAHDSSVVYHAGNHVFRMEDNGDRWTQISPDLTTNDVEKNRTNGSQAETFCTIVSLAESPIEEGVLWAGSDDGLVHVTFDGGESWADVTPDEVNGYYISSIEASPTDARTAFVAVDGHRSNFFEPILLKTTDGGASWEEITGDLPRTAPVDVVLAGPVNDDVLIVGTEQAAYATIDGGRHWVKMNAGSLPTVRVDDLALQMREMDLVAGTHGRSVWVLDDISGLLNLTPEIVGEAFHVFEPLPGVPHQRMDTYEHTSDREFLAPNPSVTLDINYWVRDYTGDSVSVSIKDQHGRRIASFSGSGTPGLNTARWDMQAERGLRLGTPHGNTEFVPAGVYTATIRFGKHSETIEVEVKGEAGRAHGPAAITR